MTKKRSTIRARKNPPKQHGLLQANKDIQREIRDKWAGFRKPTEADNERIRLAEMKRARKAAKHVPQDQ